MGKRAHHADGGGRPQRQPVRLRVLDARGQVCGDPPHPRALWLLDANCALTQLAAGSYTLCLRQNNVVYSHPHIKAVSSARPQPAAVAAAVDAASSAPRHGANAGFTFSPSAPPACRRQRRQDQARHRRRSRPPPPPPPPNQPSADVEYRFGALPRRIAHRGRVPQPGQQSWGDLVGRAPMWRPKVV